MSEQEEGQADGAEILATGKRLQKTFKEVAVSMQEQLRAESRFEATKLQMAMWRQHVKAFSQHIDTQLQFCKSLRQGHLLASLMQKTPEEEADQATQLFLGHLKSDMRALHLMLEDLRRKDGGPTSSVNLAVLAFDDDSDSDAERDGPNNKDGAARHPAAAARSAEGNSFRAEIASASAAVERRACVLEHDLAILDAPSARVPRGGDLSSRPAPPPPSRGGKESGYLRPGRNLSGGADSTNPADGPSRDGIRQLVTRHHKLLCAVLKSALGAKTAMEYKLGLNDPDASDETNALVSRYFATSSPLTRLVVTLSKEMQHLVGVVESLGYVRDGVNLVDELERQRKENEATRQAHKHAQAQVDLLEEALRSIKEERAPMNKKHLAGSQLLRIEEARQRLLKLEENLKAVQERNAVLLLANGQLTDELARARDALAAATQAQREERAWALPRIERLEKIVRTTASSFEHLSLDVELLSNMYAAACAQLEDRSSSTRDMQTELQTISEKFRNLLKRLQEEKLETKRKDRVITALMGARHEMLKSVKEAQAKAARADLEVAQTRDASSAQHFDLDAAQANNARLRNQIAELEAARASMLEENNKLRAEAEQREREHDAEVAELRHKVETLETAGMDQATRDAYDEMKLRLKHAVAAYQKLEAQVASSRS